MKKVLTAVVGLSLFMACAAPQARNPKRDQALIQASRKGDMQLVVSLIRQGADINAVDPEGWTPYLAASAEGNWQVMKVLQDMGAKTDPGF